MKFIVICGPPAVGKLTVAKELAKITGFKVFHNHLAFDLVHSLFEFDKGPFWKLITKVKMDVIEAAAKEKSVKGIIYTFCYEPNDDKQIRKLERMLKKHHVKVYYVHLMTNKKTLHKRVKHASRKNFGKIKTIKNLKNAFKKWDLFQVPPFNPLLRIDNTTLSAKKTAEMIKQYYRL
jgi:dephospho-CoA kinase